MMKGEIRLGNNNSPVTVQTASSPRWLERLIASGINVQLRGLFYLFAFQTLGPDKFLWAQKQAPRNQTDKAVQKERAV